MSNMFSSFKVNVKIIDFILIFLIYLTGFIGIRFIDKDFFLPLSFLSLLIPLLLFIYRLKPTFLGYIQLLIVFLFTFFSEWIGVNYGWIFGNYNYGNSLSIKFGGVPLMIGVNWVLLCIISRQFFNGFITNKYLIVILSTFLMLVIDIILEPIAPMLDFWAWDNIIVPFSNYRDWFIVALISQCLLFNFKLKKELFLWSAFYLLTLIVFFLTFYF
ncbi:MAG: carotene biosynthesis protein [Crocinitomicaceae bacterium]|nr:carotene biosynthesis protein [Crocinitomicaceae bacterium]